MEASPAEQSTDMQEWQDRKSKEQPQFKYWTLVLHFQITILQMIYSLRAGKFVRYVESLSKLMPWLFALDHTNYARWLSVHIRDMVQLESIHPEIYHEFYSGSFVVRKTQRKFSSIAMDQLHEQCNALIKGEGGAVGLTNNPNALRRWMIAGPEISRKLEDFEKHLQAGEPARDTHHEQHPAVQNTFAKQVNAVLTSFEEMGNPFAEGSGYLFALDTKDIMNEDVVSTVYTIHTLGEEQYNTFIEERFERRSQSVNSPIRKNKLPLFSNQKCKPSSIPKGTVTALKNDCSLFSRLYISCQSRNGNLDEFFKHENQAWPPALSKLGQLRSETKAHLISCLQAQKPASTCSSSETAEVPPAIADEFASAPAEILDDLIESDSIPLQDPSDFSEKILHENVLIAIQGSAPQVDAKLVDGAALIQMLSPKLTSTFQEYVDRIVFPYILRHFDSTSRIDIVFDVYKADSLKSAAREKRGFGARRRVLDSSQIPGNWQGFLRVNENKTELFKFVAETLVEKAKLQLQDKIMVCTNAEKVLCSSGKDTSSLEPCTHEEADTRLMLHMDDCAKEGLKRIMIRTTDTDVVVLAVSCVQSTAVEELWIALGVGKHFKYLAAHTIAVELGPQCSKALPAFHAFTGCDCVSFFSGRGKTKAWNTWAAYPQVTKAFLLMMEEPDVFLPDSAMMDFLQRFVVLLYDRTSELQSVNQARKQMFSKGKRQLENIPPTLGALQQHTLRAVYQGGHIWGQCLTKAPDLPSPGQWGWQKEQTSDWRPLWTTLPQVEQACQELISCNCKLACQGRCKCFKASLQCTALCACGGGDECSRD